MSSEPVCIVAGVGPGIGLAVARRFASEGFNVAMLARRPSELEGYAAGITATGGRARAYPVDLADPAAIGPTMARITREVGPASVLVYNAGIWRESHPMTIEPRVFTRDLELCATGALACAQAVYPAMKDSGFGTMLFTGGGLALHPEYGGSVASLAAGKSALRGLVLALAPTLEPDGIHVATVTVAGTVAPGTAFDPDRIAERFWTLHRQPRAEWDAEFVFAGDDPDSGTDSKRR